MNLPKKFEEGMEALLKEDYVKYVSSLSEKPKRGFRINKNYISVKDFDSIFTYQNQELEGFDNLRVLKSEEKLGHTAIHHAGMIYMQEPSSMLAVEALEPKDGEKILDLCSAPGGKASQILEKNKTGVVVCNEIVRNRANVLLSNIERQGFKNAIVTSKSPAELAEVYPNYFDMILVDAPCSGEGMFRKDTETIGEWNEGLPKFNHLRQMEILKEADKMLKEGGVLVYSTCTFNIDENERTVAEFSKEFGYEIIQLPVRVQSVTTKGYDFEGENTKKCGRCFPQHGFGEGQFIAKLVKKSANNNESMPKRHKNSSVAKQELKLVSDFINDNLELKNAKIHKLGNNFYLNNTNADFFSDGVVCFGVNVGTIEKNRLVPHHQLFKAYGEVFKNKVKLDIKDRRVQLYLTGNEIEVNCKNGFVCVLVEGVPLGGGKVVNGRLKNYYPKGLRMTNKE